MEAKSKLRQTTLKEFGSGIKRKRTIEERAEEAVLEDIARGRLNCGMSKDTGENRKKREKIAAAAERRRTSPTPFSALPNDSPPSPVSEQFGTGPTTLPSEKRPQCQASSKTSAKTGNSSRETSETGNSSRVNRFDSVFAYLEDDDLEDNDLEHKPSTSSAQLYPSNRTRSRGGELGASSSTKDTPGTSSGHNVVTTGDRLQKKHKVDNAMEDVVAVSDSEEEEGGGGLGGGGLSPTLEYQSSLPLFSDSEPHSSQDIDEVEINKDVTRIEWRGLDPKKLNRAPACRKPLPKLQPNAEHTVLFKPHIRSGTPPQPYPDKYSDVWDADHVRMPCSERNEYPVVDENGQKKVQSRWELIETALLSPIKNSWDLEEAILSYNSRYCGKWNFAAFHHFMTEDLDAKEAKYCLNFLLPKIIRLALMLPSICTKPIPLLKRQETHTVTLSQLQIASLLANAFFCTYPRRNAQHKKSEYFRFPEINFNRLFEGTAKTSSTNKRKAEKLRCIMNYFSRVTKNEPTGTVSFTRRALTQMPDWEQSTKELTRFHGNVYGTIEDQGEGMLQMDFANMYIGGGVLGHGLVQEEIRFMICPELIVSRLFTEVLDANECLIIKGAERYNDYTGYASSFRWNGDYQDKIPRDAWGRKETEIVAIDALIFRTFEDQFKPQLLRRELNKAYCGFYGDDTPTAKLPAIATGNWGCGAFGGDARLKGLLQMMAAAECRRDMAYFTFSDKRLCYELHKMNEFLVSQGVTVGDLWLVLQRYRVEVLQRKKRNLTNLYSFIYEVYNDFYSSTDEEGDEGEKGETQNEDGNLSPDYKVDTP